MSLDNFRTLSVNLLNNSSTPQNQNLHQTEPVSTNTNEESEGSENQNQTIIKSSSQHSSLRQRPHTTGGTQQQQPSGSGSESGGRNGRKNENWKHWEHKLQTSENRLVAALEDLSRAKQELSKDDQIFEHKIKEIRVLTSANTQAQNQIKLLTQNVSELNEVIHQLESKRVKITSNSPSSTSKKNHINVDEEESIEKKKTKKAEHVPQPAAVTTSPVASRPSDSAVRRAPLSSRDAARQKQEELNAKYSEIASRWAFQRKSQASSALSSARQSTASIASGLNGVQLSQGGKDDPAFHRAVAWMAHQAEEADDVMMNDNTILVTQSQESTQSGGGHIGRDRNVSEEKDMASASNNTNSDNGHHDVNTTNAFRRSTAVREHMKEGSGGDDEHALERAREMARLEEEEVQRLQRDIHVLAAEKEQLHEKHLLSEKERKEKEKLLIKKAQIQSEVYQKQQKEMQRQLRDLKIGLAMKQELVEDLEKANHDTQRLNQEYSAVIRRMEDEVGITLITLITLIILIFTLMIALTTCSG